MLVFGRVYVRRWLAVGALVAPAVAAPPQNLIVNGDFENTSAVGCAFNQSNAGLSTVLPGVNGFGPANEIDVMNDPSGCTYLLPPQSGTVKIGIASSVVGGPEDAFAFDLTGPLTAGAQYKLTFWGIAYAQSFAPDLAPVEIGVSNSNSSFGTLVGQATPQSGPWQQYTILFTAPSTGPYLTVHQSTLGDTWNHLDNFVLTTAAPATPSNYCTCGTTTHGCCAAMSANSNPSVTFANPCVISASNVEGQKNGLIFYGISGPAALPWNTTSFLCVKAPTQRTGTKNSQGTVNLCDGAFTLDWNAFQVANPSALGHPFASGQDIRAQAWFRDPTAPGKHSNLSNGLDLTMLP